MRRFLALILALATLVCAMASLVGCGNADAPAKAYKTREYYRYFDTVSVVSVYKSVSSQEFETVSGIVEAELERYHRLFDIYYEYSGITNIRSINKKAGEQAVTVSEELIDFLEYCKEMFTLTQGKTNIAMGSVLKLWHDFREDGENTDDPTLPTPAELEEAAKHMDINSLVIDREASTVYISDPKASLDVGAIGKGYATERIARRLESEGYAGYVLNIGGNIRAIGYRSDGSSWVTGITNPDKTSSESFVARVRIANTSIVTSGNYERFVMLDGIRYHHIIDPDTLYPSTQWSSVSVIVKDSGLADCLSTALFCLDKDEAFGLLDRASATYGVDLSALFVATDGSTVAYGDLPIVD